MRIALVGPELEENLALRYLHAALTKAGHDCRIFEFHAPAQIDPVCAAIIEYSPELVGLSMVFTARSREYVALSSKLRTLGYDGHITAGGHFASFHAEQLLSTVSSIDTIVHGEAEETLVALAQNPAAAEKVDGLSYRGPDGHMRSSARRPNRPDLDSLAWPTRTPPFHTYLGRPIANMLASRGCFGSCNFCSIAAWHSQNGGPRFRQRAPAEIAREMAHLYHEHGVRIFNFHDDNFFMPRPADSIKRFHSLRGQLRRNHVDTIAVQVKARPDSITSEVVSSLKELGLFRVFLGVESNAVAGLRNLGRGCDRQCNYDALKLLQCEGIHTTFNLLMFEPYMSADDLQSNIDMISAYSEFPLNFGRVEVYAGTPLEQQLRSEGRLLGDFYGHNYLIRDPSMQAAFELFRQVFTGRNFEATGLNLLCMRLDYYYHILRHFHRGRVNDQLTGDVKSAISELNRNSARLLGAISEFVAGKENFTAGELSEFGQGLLVWREEYDRRAREQFLALIERIEACAQGAVADSTSRGALGLTAAAAVAAIAVVSAGCDTPVGKDWHVSEMIATPNDSSFTAAPVMPQYRANTVATTIWAQYGDNLRAIARQFGYVDSTIQLELLVNTVGSVAAWRISVPPQPDSAGFSAALGQAISEWQLPRGDEVAKCIVFVSVQTLPYPPQAIDRDTLDWHVSEFIALPPDSSPALPVSLTVYDTVWNGPLWDTFAPLPDSLVTRIRTVIDSTYLAALTVAARPFVSGDTLIFDVDMILDANGKVTMFRLRDSTGVISGRLLDALCAAIAQWRFADIRAVGTAGKCTVPISVIVEDWHTTEMMPVPAR